MNIEPLEARIAPATFTVTTLLDDPGGVDDLSLREAIAAANDTLAADTINFLPTLAGSLELTAGQIAITETLTILGGGKITLVAGGNARFFTVDHPDTVKDHPLTVKGLRFFGNGMTAPGDGGAISSTEGLRIIGCLFDSMVANGDGGAVALDSDTGGLVVRDSIIKNGGTTSAGQFGAGIFADTPKPVAITGSVFFGNKNGGGVYVSTDNPKNTVAVTGSVFAYNDTDFAGAGGGLQVIGQITPTAATKVTIAGSQFTNNHASTLGGGLSVSGAVLTLNGLLVAENEAAQNGGGIHARDLRQLTMSKCVVAGNSSSNSGGGGLYLGNASADTLGATITGCQFVENEAPSGFGGGFSVSNSYGKLTLTGSQFAGNTAQFGGGLTIHEASEFPVTLTGNRFVGNVAANYGGGLALDTQGALTLKTNYIAGNEALNSGGADLTFQTKLTLSGNSIIGNRALGGAIGGLRIAGGPDATFSMSGDRIFHNETAGSVGGLQIVNDNLFMPSAGGTIAKNVRISGNIGVSDTGGVENNVVGVTLLAAVTGNFVRNDPLNPQVTGVGFANTLPTAPSPAANIIVENLNDSGPGSLRAAIEQANGTPAADKIKFAPGVSGTLTLASPLAVSETLTIYGGGSVVITGSDARRIFTVDATDDTKDHPLTLDGLILRDGRAGGVGESGGAILASEGVTLVNCLIDSSFAGGFGGALQVSTSLGSLTIKDSHFTGNEAVFDHGAVRAIIGKAITISGSTFASNTGAGGGAAGLFLGQASAKLAITGSLFFKNGATAGNAGALVLDGAVDGTKFTTAALATTAFVRNTATLSGGALRVLDGGYALTSIEFIGNTADRTGGGLATGEDVQALAVTKSLFAGNTAAGAVTGGGGGVYLGAGAAGRTSSFSATQFLLNDATGQAGAGGGLLADGTGGKLTVATSLFLANTAFDPTQAPQNETSTGGGIATRGTGDTSVVVALTGNLIAGNYAPAGGAGLSLAGDGALTLAKNLLVANGGYTAAGGAMLESLGKITLSGNTIIANGGGDAGGLLLKGGVGATFTTAGDRILFNDGLTGGLKIAGDIAGIIAKNVKITGNVGVGMIIGGAVTDAGGVMQQSTGAVRLLATVLGNLHLMDAARNETVGPFVP